MAARFELINGTLPLSGSTNDYTISGFGTPDAAMIIVSGGVNDNETRDNCILGIGFVDDAGDACIGFSAQNNTPVIGNNTWSNTHRTLYNSGIALPDPTGDQVIDGVIECSLITNGVRLNVTSAPDQEFLFTVLLIGGADVAQAEVVVKDDLGTSSGDVQVDLADSWSAAPDFVIGFTQAGNTPPDALQSNGVVSLGFSDFTNHANACIGTFDNSVGFFTTSSISNTFMLSQTFAGSIAWNGYPHTPTTTNFQFNMSASGGSDIAVFLAIGFASGIGASVFDFTVPDSADPEDINVEAVTTQDAPNYALAMTMQAPSAYATATGSTNEAFGIVQYDGTTTSSVSIALTDAATNLAKSHHSDSIDILDQDCTATAIVGTPSFDGVNFKWTLTTRPDADILGVGFAVGTDDTTAPVLSSPTGTKTGHQTASGTVSTTEGAGNLYYYASTNTTETAATIKANGTIQSVTASGVQNVTFTGLTESTLYYAHYVQDDAAYSPNESNRVSSSPGFTTDPNPDPTFAVVNGTLPTSGTTNLTKTGFGTPKGCLLIISGAQWDAAEEAGAVIGYGFMDDTTQGSITFAARDTDTSSTARSLYTALAAGPLADSASAALDFDINGTFITDGVQLSIVDAPAGAYQVTAMLIGGTGIEQLEVIIHDDLGATTGDQAVSLSKVWTNAPNLVIGATAGDSTGADNVESEGTLSFGFSNFTKHAGLSFGGVDDSTGEYMTALASNTSMLSRTYNGAVDWTGYPHTPTTSNFQFNTSASTSNSIAIFMVIGIASGYGASVDHVTIPSSSDVAISPGVDTPYINLVATLQGPSSYDILAENVDIATGVVIFDGTDTGAASASVSDSAAKSHFTDAVALMAGDGSTTMVAGIPLLEGNTVEWVTAARPASDVLGISLSFGVDALSISPSTITIAGGTTAPATLSIPGLAGAGGLVVSLSSDDTGVATVPASATIPAGESEVSFNITGVGTNGTATITGTNASYDDVTIVVTATIPPLETPKNMYFGHLGDWHMYDGIIGAK